MHASLVAVQVLWCDQGVEGGLRVHNDPAQHLHGVQQQEGRHRREWCGWLTCRATDSTASLAYPSFKFKWAAFTPLRERIVEDPVLSEQHALVPRHIRELPRPNRDRAAELSEESDCRFLITALTPRRPSTITADDCDSTKTTIATRATA